jgi:hypothetical protein
MKENKNLDPEEFLETHGDLDQDIEDTHAAQKNYFKTPQGKKALRRAREKYDKQNPDKRRKQKRDYMRRKRDKNPDAWRD